MVDCDPGLDEKRREGVEDGAGDGAGESGDRWVERMRKVFQTKFGPEEGNCFQACLASLLEIPIEGIPEPEEGEDQFGVLNAWLKENHGKEFLILFGRQTEVAIPRTYHLIGGKSPRYPDEESFGHIVVGHRGVMVHDPHPDGGGVLGVEEWTFLVPHRREG